jgi:hypothetical protein
MKLRFVPLRVHGMLDDTAWPSYLLVWWLLDVQGHAASALFAAAALHFVNTRVTDYPQGQLKLWSFGTHRRVEFAEGLAVIAAGLLLAETPMQSTVIAATGALQVIAGIVTDA